MNQNNWRVLSVTVNRGLNRDYTHVRFSECNLGEFTARKLGSNLGPFTPRILGKPWSETQNQAERINKIGYRLLLRDQLFLVLFSIGYAWILVQFWSSCASLTAKPPLERDHERKGGRVLRLAAIGGPAGIVRQ